MPDIYKYSSLLRCGINCDCKLFYSTDYGFLKVNVWAWNPYWTGRLLELTSLDQLLLKIQALFTFYKTSYLNEEVNGTEPFPSFSVPWFEWRRHSLTMDFDSNGAAKSYNITFDLLHFRPMTFALLSFHPPAFGLLTFVLISFVLMIFASYTFSKKSNYFWAYDFYSDNFTSSGFCLNDFYEVTFVLMAFVIMTFVHIMIVFLGFVLYTIFK